MNPEFYIPGQQQSQSSGKTENLEAFAAECADILLSGAKVIEVGQWR